MRYLLGTLSEGERAQFEERYFSDDAEFEEIEIAEEELIDRYVRGELSKSDRDRFEQTLAGSPRLTERVEFARVFADKLRVAESPIKAPVIQTEKTNWWGLFFGFSNASRSSRLAFGFSVLLVLVAGGVLLVGWWQLRQQSRLLAAQEAALDHRQRQLDQQAAMLKAQSDQLAKEGQPVPLELPTPQQVSQEPTPQAGAPIFFLTLSPGTTRSASGSSQIRITPGTNDIQLTLKLRATDYASYRASINSVDRKDVFSKSGLKPRVTKNGSVLIFRVPTQHLQQGDYYVSLYGEPANESVDDYPFRVIK